MIAEDGWTFYERIWRPAQLVVSDLERVGFPIDVPRCERGAEETRALLVPLSEQLSNWAGQDIKWSSPKEVGQFLYGTEPRAATKRGAVITPKGFDVPPVKGSTSATSMMRDDETSTSAASIEYLADHVPDLADRRGLRVLREYAVEVKNLQFWVKLPTFVDSNGRIHCNLGALTETGRLSSKNPNLQNIPIRTPTGKLIREAFIARPGYVLVIADYPALEWRILAHCLVQMYGDTSLLDEILANICPHSATAVRMRLCPGPVEVVKKLYPTERGYAKTINYGVNYGKTDVGLGVAIRDDQGEPVGTARGAELLEAFFNARPGVAKFQGDMVGYAKRTGKVVSLLGRPRYITLPLTRYDNRKRKEVVASGGRQALNVIQNCAADIVTLAMIRCHPRLHPELRHWDSDERRELNRLGAEQLLQCHDELVFEAPEGNGERVGQILAHRMAHSLEGVRDFRCPLGPVDFAVGPNWAVKS